MTDDRFPFPDGPLSTQPPEYARRRETCPMSDVTTPTGDPAVLVLKYHDVEAVMRDRRFSRDLSAPGTPRLFPSNLLSDDPDFLMNMHGEDHRRLRRIVASAFTPRRAEQWRPEVRRIADDLLDRVEAEGPPADLMAALSYQLPVRVICRQLGVPDEEGDKFQGWVAAFLSVSGMSMAEREVAAGEFTGYVEELVRRHRTAPGDDLVDQIVNARDEEDRLTEAELVSLVRGLIVGGNETVANSLSRCVLTLLSHRGLWDDLVRDRSDLPAAVEELLRVNPPGRIGLLRVATEDVELPSGTVRAGQAVISPLIAAGHDPEVFPEPDRIVLGREPQTLQFGAGPHFCLGVHLARVELQEALSALMDRFPGLELTAPPEDLPWNRGGYGITLSSLPVRW
ncbi:cytochrome P450 [Umezawaea tangerina]|uniref:Cytochrome P450 n=1 Tax=Umezawaea tangerina TaxID=84725 RepID=A0A2T0SNC7_9PSEU|nr:cytochrome P450 [Umezawaea tangerina]PRY34883.1 cytochrome P450 [Umezawaea tangerina]